MLRSSGTCHQVLQRSGRCAYRCHECCNRVQRLQTQPSVTIDRIERKLATCNNHDGLHVTTPPITPLLIPSLSQWSIGGCLSLVSDDYLGRSCTMSGHMILRWCVVALLLQAACSGHGLDAERQQKQHIVVIPTAVSTSDSLDAMYILAELANRGHACSILALNDTIPFWQAALDKYLQPHASCTFLPYADPHPKGARSLLMDILTRGNPSKGLPTEHLAVLMHRMLQFALRHCQALVEKGVLSKAVQQLLQPTALRPTAVLAFPTDQCAGLVAGMLRVPVIGLSAMSGSHLPLGIPQMSSGLSPKQLSSSWSAKVHNTLLWLQFQSLPYLLPQQPWQHLVERLELPSQLLKSSKPLLTIRLVSPELEHPLPLPPREVMVGGISMHPPTAISDPAVAAFMDGAGPGGVLVVTFGSTILYGSHLTAEDYKQLALAFSRLGAAEAPAAPAGAMLHCPRNAGTPASQRSSSSSSRSEAVCEQHNLTTKGHSVDQQNPSAAVRCMRVLWSVRDHSLPGNLTLADLPLGPNTKVVNWIDQNAVLGHPSTRAFLSAGGLHSLYEAAFHGVPLIGVPFTTEQMDTVRKGEARGFAFASPEASVFAARNKQGCQKAAVARNASVASSHCVTFSSCGVVAAVEHVLTRPAYKQSAQAMGRILRARYHVRRPLQKAADEIEFALMWHWLMPEAQDAAA